MADFTEEELAHLKAAVEAVEEAKDTEDDTE